MCPSRTRLRPRLAGLSRGLQHSTVVLGFFFSLLRGKTTGSRLMLPGEFPTCVMIKNLDWSTANIMLASTLMWASSAPMMLLILGVSGTWTIGAQVRTSPLET